MPFTQMGVSMECGSSYFLPRLIGIARACELIFTSRMIDAREAGEIGLVNHVVPVDKLASFTREMAGSIARLAPQSLQVCKKELYQGMNADLSSQLEYEGSSLKHLFASKDFAEAVKAFMEKREPVFTGE